jgi:two-component system, NarL family, response regulator NreC
MSIRILIADDHGILRDGLHVLIQAEPGYEVAGEAANGQEAIRLVASLHPDIILMDISMPDISGIEATRQIKALKPDARILFLTVHEDKGLLQEAIQSGASGYILKRAVKTDLFNAIRTIMGGGIYLHPGIMQTLMGAAPEAETKKDNKLDELTPREVEVLRLLARGYTNQQIADELVISSRTVQFHRGNLTEKLQLHSRVELVHFAVENGLVDFHKTTGVEGLP